MNNLESLPHLGTVVAASKKLGEQEAKIKRKYGNGNGTNFVATGSVEKYQEMVQELSPKVIECEDLINELYSQNDQLQHQNNNLTDKILQLEKQVNEYQSRNFFQRLADLF